MKKKMPEFFAVQVFFVFLPHNFFCTWIIRKICEIRVRLLHHHGFACCTEKGSDNVTEDLEYCFYCFVHSVVCF